MHLLSEDLFAKQKYAQECRFKEEGERTLHRQCLGDDLTCVRRESGPVRAKLKLHRYAGHDAKHEGNGKNFPPEMRACVVALIFAPHIQDFENHEEQCQPHRELGKKVVKGNRKSKL